MKSFKLVISSPDGDAYRGDCWKLVLRGLEGDLAILADHIPFITSVKPGECRIHTEEAVRTAQIAGGLLTVSAKEVTLLAGSIRWQDAE